MKEIITLRQILQSIFPKGNLLKSTKKTFSNPPKKHRKYGYGKPSLI